jgi:2-methylisocitrate lyase-like PEP mutase family enzyme
MEPIFREIVAAANEKSSKLRELVRAPEILVMPGAFDVFTAMLFERLGFAAIQGTSGGIAAVLGLPDGEIMTREQFIEVSGQMAAAVSVPVNADGEAGYGDANEIGETVRFLIGVGCAGMNLEDSGPKRKDQPRRMVELPRQMEKLRAVAAAKRAIGSKFFVNARVDALMVMAEDPDRALGEAITRGNAYAEAGADCIFFLRADARETIRRLVAEVRAPVSILAGPQAPSVPELQDLGVARVSYGTAFHRMAMGAVKRLALELRDQGTITSLKEGLPSNEIAAIVEQKGAS